MYCDNCGKQISDNVSFCRYCGHSIPSDYINESNQSSIGATENSSTNSDENSGIRNNSTFSVPDSSELKADEFLDFFEKVFVLRENDKDRLNLLEKVIRGNYFKDLEIESRDERYVLKRLAPRKVFVFNLKSHNQFIIYDRKENKPYRYREYKVDFFIGKALDLIQRQKYQETYKIYESSPFTWFLVSKPFLIVGLCIWLVIVIFAYCMYDAGHAKYDMIMAAYIPGILCGLETIIDLVVMINRKRVFKSFFLHLLCCIIISFFVYSMLMEYINSYVDAVMEELEQTGYSDIEDDIALYEDEGNNTALSVATATPTPKPTSTPTPKPTPTPVPEKNDTADYSGSYSGGSMYSDDTSFYANITSSNGDYYISLYPVTINSDGTVFTDYSLENMYMVYEGNGHFTIYDSMNGQGYASFYNTTVTVEIAGYAAVLEKQ